jgi:hypothetical protein
MPWGVLAKLLIQLLEGYPRKKYRVNLYAIPLKNLIVEIKSKN